MRKSLISPDRPGASAEARYRRARRSTRRRRRICAVCAVGAAAAVAAGIGGRRWGAALAAALGLVAWWAWPAADPERWLRGAAGEAATAGLLATLPRRFVVLHDRRVPGTRANIDHLVIGPTGVWVVDSKSYRAALRVRRGVAWAGEHEVPAAPAAWEAERAAEALGGREVRAVVAVHGAGLRRRGARVGEVRILPAGRLCRRLRRGPRTLGRAEVAALAATADRLLPPAA